MVPRMSRFRNRLLNWNTFKRHSSDGWEHHSWCESVPISCFSCVRRKRVRKYWRLNYKTISNVWMILTLKEKRSRRKSRTWIWFWQTQTHFFQERHVPHAFKQKKDKKASSKAKLAALDVFNHAAEAHSTGKHAGKRLLEWKWLHFWCG